jgi:hypothetical protein
MKINSNFIMKLLTLRGNQVTKIGFTEGFLKLVLAEVFSENTHNSV